MSKPSNRGKTTFVLAGILAWVFAAACKGGGNDLADAMKHITDEQLAIMVLPQAELGVDAAGLPVDPSAGAGFIDSAMWAEGSPDPDDTAADAEAAGFVKGYELSYADYSGTQPVLEFDTAVFLFESADNASAGLIKFIDDFQAAAESGQDQYGHRDIVVKDEDGIGDEAKLLTATIELDDEDGKGVTSAVFFRYGRLLAYASENRSDDQDTAENSRAAARAMEQRIQGVLKGDIEETPVPIPSEEETAAIQIQGVLDQISEAFNNKDIEGYAGFWTDSGFQEGFNSTRDEALSFLNESIGEPPIDFKNVSNVSLSDNGATFEVDFIDGTVVKHARFSIVDDGSGPKIDGVEYLETAIPTDATPIDLALQDFSFGFDAASITSGNIAFRAQNDGAQPHEIVIETVPAGIDIAQTFQDAFAADSEPAGVEFVAYINPIDPGAAQNVVLTQALAPGRYALLCFVPDANGPAGTPHAFKGMIGEFTVQ